MLMHAILKLIFTLPFFQKVLSFWLAKGVAGFRVDAIPHLVESDVFTDGNYIDEPRSGHTDDDREYKFKGSSDMY